MADVKKNNSVRNISGRKPPEKKRNPAIYLVAGALVVVVALILLIRGGSGGKSPIDAEGNLVIPKSEVTGTAKFYPYKSGSTKMEVLAVKAPDGTVRTAFNTCQVCFSSGRGYYKQEGDELVCQNCGNRFKTSQVEKLKGGCNPVPILDENKSDDGAVITISKEFLDQAQDLFANWKN